MTTRFAALALPLLANKVIATLTPTAPGPGETYSAGSNCTIQWDVDQSGIWTNVTIGASVSTLIFPGVVSDYIWHRLEVRIQR